MATGVRWRVLVLALAVVLSGCAGDDDGASDPEEGAAESSTPPEKTFRDDRFPFTFAYPADFRKTDDVEASLGTEAPVNVAIGPRGDEDNGIAISSNQLNVAVTRENLSDAVEELDEVVRELTGTRTTGSVMDVGGFLAIGYPELAVPGPGLHLRSRFVVLLEGRTQYQLNCQSTPAGRATIHRACDQPLDVPEKMTPWA